ncbi:unnamed protein product [Cunninghamella blakesleeana]
MGLKANPFMILFYTFFIISMYKMETILIFLVCIVYFLFLVNGLPQVSVENGNNEPWSPTPSNGLQNALPSEIATPSQKGIMGEINKMKLGFNAYDVGKKQIDKVLNSFHHA